MKYQVQFFLFFLLLFIFYFCFLIFFLKVISIEQLFVQCEVKCKEILYYYSNKEICYMGLLGKKIQYFLAKTPVLYYIVEDRGYRMGNQWHFLEKMK